MDKAIYVICNYLSIKKLNTFLQLLKNQHWKLTACCVYAQGLERTKKWCWLESKILWIRWRVIILQSAGHDMVGVLMN